MASKLNNLKFRYGITSEEYRNVLQKQDSKCAICGAVPGKRSLHVDHDHETGKIRGLLCHKCNVGLGHFSDDPNLLIKASKYLE